MDPNIAAWMIGGGPRIADPHATRDREQLHALRERQRLAPHEPHLLARLARFIRSTSTRPDPACCPA